VSEGLLISDEDARRIARVVRAYESSQVSARVGVVRDGPTYVLVLDAPLAAGAGPYQGVLSTPIDDLTWTDMLDIVDVRGVNNEILTAGDRYRSDMIAYAADGTPIFLAIATCCPGQSGSGSGSGSGAGEVVTACCPGVAIPTTLYLTFAATTGSITGTYPMHYAATGAANGGGPVWSTTDLVFGTCTPGSGAFAVQLYCTLIDGTYQWQTFTTPAQTSPAVVTCSPFSATSNIYEGPGAGFGFCGGVGSGDITITATDPGGGGNAACVTGGCGSAGVPATLTATVTAPVGCYVGMAGSFTLACQTFVSSGVTSHYWQAASMPICGAAFAVPTVMGSTSAPPSLNLGLSAGAGTANADAGYSCSPFAAVFHVNDNAGNSCTVAVS